MYLSNFKIGKGVIKCQVTTEITMIRKEQKPDHIMDKVIKKEHQHKKEEQQQMETVIVVQEKNQQPVVVEIVR